MKQLSRCRGQSQDLPTGADGDPSACDPRPVPAIMAAGAPIDIWFTEGEVREQLRDLGYDNVAPDVFEAFVRGENARRLRCFCKDDVPPVLRLQSPSAIIPANRPDMQP